MVRGNQYNQFRLTAFTVLLLALTLASGCPVNQQSSQSGPAGKTGTTSPTAQATTPVASPATPATPLTPLANWPADGSIKAYA